MNIRRAVPAALLATTAASALLLSGCAGTDDARADTGAGDRLGVIASFYPMKFVAEQVGGPHVKVTNLTKAGAEPHDLELTPKQVGKLSKADLVVYLKGLQPAVDEAIKQNKPRHTVEVSRLAPLEEHGTEVHGAEDEHEGHHHEDAEHGDPHVWLDPTRLAAIATGVGESLAAADPANAQDYRARAADLVTRLNGLDGEFTAGLATCARKDVVTSHAAFGYLAERYHLNQIAVNGVNPESEPSPARRADIQKLARDKGVTTIYFETLAEPKTARTLAQDLRIQTAVLDPLEGIKDEARSDYFSVMRANLDALRKGLGCS
ncbi:metal ABC transporter substrate-binding protein [Embleya sp. NBC_00896]|uniref:metal ABC transporter substrate-binding protein n=1 Tax=Embleya sp. NBC_00896 TaxID=2975961 RepID=UPI00386F2D38|nr:metal ABC transporter substrate-binding protein [Embleya sp. NBC_00896]